MKIALIGFEFESSNKGCEALTYSFLPILSKIIPKKSEIIVINIHDTLGEIPVLYNDFTFKNIHIRLKNIKSLWMVKRELKTCNIAFDITHGDSFSDIYGKKWLVQTNLIKQMVINQNVPLILLPQTYGPFNSEILEKWTIKILNNTYAIYSRDNLSTEYLKKILSTKYHNKISTYTDLAFALPYNKKKYNLSSKKKKIGINISGLLWNDCINSNKFNLNVNYRDYCIKLIETLLLDKNNEIFLVPHVICDEREGNNYFENDTTACKEVKKMFPMCNMIDKFENASDAKSLISNLDCLVAARMHASIAAFSSNCASIPFAYSRKFAGIYNSLEYNYIIDGRKETTQDAINKTISYITKSEILKKEASKCMGVLLKDLDAFQKDLANNIEIIKRSSKYEENNKRNN